MATVFLGLGSNIEPARHLTFAIAELTRRFGDLDQSPVYRNPPVGFDGEDFLNMVVRLHTGLSPAAVVAELEQIHVLAGRRRPPSQLASRELDIDLLLYDRRVSRPAGGIELPRRDVLEYDFVLRPLAELAPEYVHPLTGRRLADHWAEQADAGRPMTRVSI